MTCVLRSDDNTYCKNLIIMNIFQGQEVMVMVMNLYSAFSIGIFKCALQASDLWAYRRIFADVIVYIFAH